VNRNSVTFPAREQAVRPRAPIVIVAVAGVCTVLMALDIHEDYVFGGSAMHLLLEGVILTGSTLLLVMGLGQLFNAHFHIAALEDRLNALQEERDHWHRETQDLLAGLSTQIEKQFARWGLTPAETDVGFLLLKGYSLKDIAGIRGTKAKTTHQQVQAIYDKTKLHSRSELAAFFLEDLLPKHEDRGHPAVE